MKTTIDIKSLIGVHQLSGVDTLKRNVERYGDFEDSNVINFVLDDKTYTAIEDPSDGYRSSLEDIYISEDKILNSFTPIKVVGIKKPDTYEQNDVVSFYDCVTGKIVLEVGTENIGDYYPRFVGDFYPENMCLNTEK